MDHYQIISSSFQSTMESIAMAVDEVADPLASASELMGEALLQDGKILCCGEGPDAALASLFTTHLLAHFDRERPALPALCLTADGASLSGICSSSGADDVIARQVRALGQPGDILLCLDSARPPGAGIRRAVRAAAERGLTVVSLSRDIDEPAEGIVAIRVNATQRHRAVELYTMIIHCLCELIDHKLFGPHYQED